MQIPTIFKRYASFLLLAWIVQSPLAHSALIGLQPTTTLANNGDSISLDLVISGLGDFEPDSLGAFDLLIGFDTSALSFTGYNLDGFLGDVGLSEAIDASTGVLGGTINIAEVSLLSVIDLDALQPGSFTLATLNFNVIDLAVGAVTQLSVMSGFVLADADGFALSATAAGPASVQGAASAIPVPGTLVLFAASLLGWLTLIRRQPR